MVLTWNVYLNFQSYGFFSSLRRLWRMYMLHRLHPMTGGAVRMLKVTLPNLRTFLCSLDCPSWTVAYPSWRGPKTRFLANYGNQILLTETVDFTRKMIKLGFCSSVLWCEFAQQGTVEKLGHVNSSNSWILFAVKWNRVEELFHSITWKLTLPKGAAPKNPWVKKFSTVMSSASWNSKVLPFQDPITLTVAITNQFLHCSSIKAQSCVVWSLKAQALCQDSQLMTGLLSSVNLRN